MKSIRGMRAVAAAAAFVMSLGLLALGPSWANSGVREKIEARNRQAMESYDLLDYEAAKRQLNEAVGLAKKHGLRDAAVARTYLNLAIVYFSGFQDVESAKIAFIDAVQLDPGIQIDPAYRTSELVQLLARTKEEYSGTGSEGGGSASGCAAVIGIEHTIVDSAVSGEPREIKALVSGELGARRVKLYYRSRGSTDFREARMKKTGECEYTGQIPGKAVSGDAVHYYVAALNRRGKPVASRGSSASPNIIEVGESGGGLELGGDTENPLGETGGGGDVEKKGEVESGGSASSLFLLLPIGTGGGYVTGQTEQMDNDVGCCFAPALLNLSPEVGYFLNPGMAVAAAFRMGFPVGANLPGHATGAPSGLLRVRYGPKGTLTGLHAVGSLGAGLLRHTIKLSEAPAGMDTDTVASGPLLLGAGLAYWKDLGGPMRFVAELHTIAGLPVVKEMGTCPGAGCVNPSFALHFDVNLGILFSF